MFQENIILQYVAASVFLKAFSVTPAALPKHRPGACCGDLKQATTALSPILSLPFISLFHGEWAVDCK